MCEVSSVQGALMAVAYSPNQVPADSSGVPVIDLIVTQTIGAGTYINFRFYPLNDGYLSINAVTASFYTTENMNEDTFVRIYKYADKTTFTHRLRGSSEWKPIAASTRPIAIPNWATCFIYFCAKSSACKVTSVVPVSAVGTIVNPAFGTVILPTFPPCQVLDCKYALLAKIPSVDYGGYVYYDGGDYSVAGNWSNTWETLRIRGTWNRSEDYVAYEGIVMSAEDAFFIRLLPGQIVPIAFSKYNQSATVGAQWAIVVTNLLPRYTVVNIHFNDWSVGILDLGNMQWSSPHFDLPPGTVVLFSCIGLPSSVLTVSHGSVTYGTGYTPGNAVYAITAYAASVASGPFPVTGTYTCTYTGSIPTELVPGINIHKNLWPDVPTMLALYGCRFIQSWCAEAILINKSCFRLWVCQQLPSWLLMSCDDKHGNLAPPTQMKMISRTRSCKTC